VLYEAIESDLYGMNLNMEKTPNLEFLAEQGVLLLNCSLTCEPELPTIHVDLWKPFMEFFFKKLNTEFSSLHIVFFGEDAQQYAKLVNEQKSNGFSFPNHHFLYKEKHPSFYARNQIKMETNIFSLIKRRLFDNFQNVEFDTFYTKPSS
jgi:Uracil DNA glycosylase